MSTKHWKRRLCALLLPCMLGAGMGAASTGSAAALPGDANSDGRLSLADIVLVQRALWGERSLTADEWTVLDLHADNRLDVNDLVILKRMILYGSTQSYEGLCINEVCTSNKGSHSDSGGNTPDWLELYNASDTPLSLGGLGISDSADEPFRYTFPEGTVLAPEGYLLVYCDDAVYTAEGEHHAPFKLSAAGETLTLTHPTLGTLDTVTVPALSEDITYGRYFDAADTLYTLTPTPAATNNTAQRSVIVDAPTFSREGGFYGDPFTLLLTAGEGMTIRYTTDGSDPASSETAVSYTGGIDIYDNTKEPNVYSAIEEIRVGWVEAPSYRVDKGMVIRAVAVDADGNCSDIVTHSYFINKQAGYYSDMKVISLVTDSDNLFDPETGIYVNGNMYYDWLNSPDYEEYQEGDTANPTNYNQSGREWERPVTVQVFEQGSLAYTADVGIRIAGNWSRGAPQKSLRLYARSEYGDSKMNYAFIEGLTDAQGNPIDSFDKITLRNGGTDFGALGFRDSLIQGLVADRAADTQATEPCIVFIDGEFWGYYTITERTDDEYYESHYGIDKENITIIKNAEGEGDQTVVDEYMAFAEWALSADLSLPENYQRVCDTLDIQSFMDYIAIETYINNADWSGEGIGYMNNWQMWRANITDSANPYADGKWRFTLFDTEFSTALFQQSSTSHMFDSIGTMYREEIWYNFTLIFYRLLENEVFAEQFYDNYLQIMTQNFDPDTVNGVIDENVTALRSAIYATNSRFMWNSSNNAFDGELQRFRDFWKLRPQYAKYYLDLLYGNADLYTGSNILPSVSALGSYTSNGSAMTLFKNTETGGFTANVTALGSNNWDSQAFFPNLALENGTVYQLSFTASCTTGGQLELGFTHQEGGSYVGCGYTTLTLSDTPKEYVLNLPMTGTTASNWSLFFNLSLDTGTYVLENISLCPVVLQ